MTLFRNSDHQYQYVGHTDGGPPTAGDGSFVQGNWCRDNDEIFVCVAPGTPGQWESQKVSGTSLALGPAPSADATGVTDTAALQAALDAIATTGGTLILRPGMYYCANLTLTNAVNVIVTGPGAKITWVGAVGPIGFQLVGVCTNVTICDLTLIGDGTAGHNHQGVWCNSGQTLTNIKILRNRVTTTVVGISLNADSSGSITGFLIEGNFIDTPTGTAAGQGYGIHHSNGSGNASHGRIVNNVVTGAQRHSIYQAKGSGVVIAGNTIRNHRTGQTQQGSPFCAIVVSRSTDCVVANNIIDTPNDGAIEISPVVGFSSRNITIVGNVINLPTSTVPIVVVIGGTVPATDGFPEEITFEGNTIYSSGISGPLVMVYCGKRINIVGNTLTCLVAPTTGSVIQIRGTTETAGTSLYTDDVMVKDNVIYATNGAGACSAFEFYTTACAAGFRVDFKNNRVKTTSTAFLFDAAQTNLAIRCVDSLKDGVPTTDSVHAQITVDSVDGDSRRGRVTFTTATPPAAGNVLFRLIWPDTFPLMTTSRNGSTGPTILLAIANGQIGSLAGYQSVPGSVKICNGTALNASSQYVMDYVVEG